MTNTINTTKDLTMRELNHDEIGAVSGGGFYESAYGDENLYRAGISYVNCAITRDEYWIGSTRISKDTAITMRERSMKIWKDKYSESGDLVGFIKEWRKILLYEYNISWDGKCGEYSVGF